MNMGIRLGLSLGLFSICGLAASQAGDIKISAVYPGGGSATANTYVRDHIELLNTSNTVISLNGLSLQYGSATGNYGSSASNVIAFNSGHSIAAKSYFLVTCGTAGAPSPALTSPTPDLLSGNISMGAASGKIALVAQSAALNSKPSLPSALIIDTVAWGLADNAEGGSAANNASVLNSTLAIFRKNLGQQDTDNNNNDFDVAVTTSLNPPRNSSSSAVPVALSSFELD